DGRYWITFNGEIYNFLELRAELQDRGHRFHTESDTEVILAAYAEWGEACQLRFNGMWAFGIWDCIANHLFLARDRFGVKPLYYSNTGRQFAFASEMKAFLSLGGFVPSIDPDVLAFGIANPFSIEAQEGCLLRGLKRL